MAEYKELVVLSTAQQGLESLGTSAVRAFCLPRDFMLPRVSIVSFVVDTMPDVIPYLGIYDAATGELVTYSNYLLPCTGTLEDTTHKLVYKTNDVVEAGPEDPGFIFAFYNDIPPHKCYPRPGALDVVLRNGATLEYTLDTAWSLTEASESNQMPYVELSPGVMYTDDDELDCTAVYIPYDEVGEAIVSVLGNTKFYGTFVNTDAGVVTYNAPDSSLHSSDASAVAVYSSITPSVSIDNLESGRFPNLYVEEGWRKLLTFKLPDSWEWDVCSIRPNSRNEYTLCGRVHHGALEWQFGNLVSDSGTPAADGSYEKHVFNEETGQWEVVVVTPGGSGGGGSEPSSPASSLAGFVDCIASTRGSFSAPILRWAGEEESKKTMLKDGKLRASCEPVYLGMFNLSMSYLAGIVYDIVDDSNCAKPCDFSSNQSYYEAVQEVSPVWFLFASTKNDALNLVAIEHKIYAGEMDGTWEVPEDVTDPYVLYGPPPKVLDKYCEGKPPVSYENFRIWLYTNFILPPSRDMVYVPEDTEELAAGYYYVHNVTGAYYRIPDDLIESGCKTTPSPRWMEAHSVVDTDEGSVVDVPLCAFGKDNTISLFNNRNKRYRGFFDNVLDYEYRWQRVDNTWKYVPYTDSGYVADINRTEGLRFHSRAYLPIGSRYSKSYASYTNCTFVLSASGRCLTFDVVNSADGAGDSIVGDGTYVISAPGGVEYSSSVFRKIDAAPVPVKSIAVLTGSTFAYDTPPEYNITDISVFEGDVGDGNIAVTGAATVYDSADKLVLMDDVSYTTPNLIAPGFILSDCKVVDGPESGVSLYEAGSLTLPSSTYTGTLILQGRNIPAINLTSFSNVILDQAAIHPIKNSVFGNVTVPNDTLGVISFPEELSTVIPVRDPATDVLPKYVDQVISATTADGGEEIFGKVINGRTVFAFAQHVIEGSSFPAVVFGEGDGAEINTEAGLLITEDNEITGLKAYLKMTSRPRRNNQYAGIFYNIPGLDTTSKLRLSFDVEYGSEIIYPIQYSVWLPYAVDSSSDGGPQTVCLVPNTLLAEDDQHVSIDIELPEEGEISKNNTPVLVLFVTPPDLDSAGENVLVKNILMKATYNSASSNYAEYADSLLDSGDIHIETLHVDESGRFAFCSGQNNTITVDSLEGSGVVGIGVVPDGYFKNAAGTSSLEIINTARFEGMYYLGEGISQFNIPEEYKIAIDTGASLASLAVRGAPCITDCFRVTGNVMLSGYIPSINVSTAILEDNSTLRSDVDGIALSANELVIGNGASVDMITSSTTCTTSGSFTVSKLFKSERAVIRGTVINAAGVPLFSTFVVNLYNGLDNFEQVANGTEVYVAEVAKGESLSPVTSGAVTVVSDDDAYYYAIKGNATPENPPSNVRLDSEIITTASVPDGAPVRFFRTVDGSVVFKLPAGYDQLTSTSSDSSPIDSSIAFILEGNMDFAVNDRYMDLTTWTDVDRLSRYYIKDVNDPDNTCYELERTTLTCCDPTPVDCCETDPSNCNKNCGTPPNPCPDGNTNIPGCGGDDNGGGNGNNNKDDDEENDDDDPGGGGGGGGGGGTIGGKPSDWSPPENAGKHMYTAQGQVYLYMLDDSFLKGTYTNVDAKVVGTRGGSASSNRVTFSVPAHKLKFSFNDVSNHVIGQGARIAEVAGEMTFPVTFTMDKGPQSYNYPKGKECVAGTMYYGMNSLTSAGANHLRLGIIYNSSDNGGPKGKTTYTRNIKMPIEDIGVAVKISDTFEVGPTQAPKSIDRQLKSMGLLWAQTSSTVKKVYNGADYSNIRINKIRIYTVANFRGRVISNSIPSAKLKCRGKLRGSIELGSTGVPADGPTITATSGTSGNVNIWRKDGAGPGKSLSLKTKLMVTNYTMAGDTLTTISGSLQNAAWDYCIPGQALGENVTEYPRSRASGKIFGNNYIIVEGELMNS